MLPTLTGLAVLLDFLPVVLAGFFGGGVASSAGELARLRVLDQLFARRWT